MQIKKSIHEIHSGEITSGRRYNSGWSNHVYDINKTYFVIKQPNDLVYLSKLTIKLICFCIMTGKFTSLAMLQQQQQLVLVTLRITYCGCCYSE